MNKYTALYIHIPFCMKKCYYCDFPSYSGKEKLMLEYSKALGKEIESLGDMKIGSIFVGGGTPTYLPLDCWQILKKSIEKLNKKSNIEFTVEGNPGTFTKEKLLLLKKMGVNRLSIGLQACQDTILKDLGRIHTLRQFEESYNMARKVEFKNINIDLMFGLPNQTLKQWNETLKYTINLNPEHISCYSLIIEEGTEFHRNYKDGQLDLPNEDIERDMYKDTLKVLKKQGYYQYEISNFSKPGKQCRHNIVYWSLDDYVGCGTSAHSYVDGIRYNNVDNVETYINKINLTESAVLERHKNSLKDNIEEFIFMGLRKTKGINTNEFTRRFHIDIKRIYGNIIRKYINQGLLMENSGWIYLSPRGVELSNIVMSDFIL